MSLAVGLIGLMRIAPIELVIPIGDITLAGTLAVPRAPMGFVMFAHGSGSSRFSPRNRHVAARLQDRGLATLLVDLFTADEEQLDAVSATLRFDVGTLAERLISATDSVVRTGHTLGLPLGYFGGGTGAAAALIAASRRPHQISAVVGRSARPDLARDCLTAVSAPTLLIVGSADQSVIALNRDAVTRIPAPHRVEVVAGAGHLFEEPGALDEVARLAGDWFVDHFGHSSLKKAS